MAQVSFEDVSKSYGGAEILQNLNLELPDGSFTVLVGPSGCGKSTTLRMLAGLEGVTSGRIRIGDRDVTDLEPKKRDVAMVFQNYALYPHLTVKENIGFPLKARGTSRQEIEEQVNRVADFTGIGELLARRPRQLSGGQQQRVAIARAIVRTPSVFLFDEPLSNLDAQLRVEMRSEILRIQRTFGATTLYVTHDQEEAMTLSDQMVVMDRGAIAQIGTPAEVYDRPVNTFVAGFVGSPKINLLSGAVADGVLSMEDGGRIELPESQPGAALIGIRPEELIIGAEIADSAEGSTSGTAQVSLVELVGPRVIVTLSVGGHVVRAVTDVGAARGLRVGSRVKLSVGAGGYHRFDPHSERLIPS